MKQPRPWSLQRSTIIRAVAALLPLTLGASACELIASVDRSHIDGGAGQPGEAGGQPGEAGQSSTGARAGSGGNGGSGGDSGSGNEAAAGNDAGSGQGGVGVEAGSGGLGGEPGSAGEGGAPHMAGAPGEPGSGGEGGGTGEPAGKVIYLTGTPKKANFGGISGADAECNASPPSPGAYKALIVDGTTRVACTTASCGGGVAEHVDWVLAPDTTYVRPDGTVIGTTNGAGIFVFPLESSIGTAGYSYWTGFSADWTASSDDCGDWGQTAGYFANEGLADATDSQAIAGVSESCATLAGAFFVCVEQ